MNAEIVTVGNEIVSGRVVDTNAAFLGRGLEEIGISAEWITSVGDDRETLGEALHSAVQRVGVVLVTGGLGPTHDDITRDVVAEYFGLPLELDERVLSRIRDRFAHQGLVMPAVNRNQALVPQGAAVLDNDWGTAPGLCLESAGCRIFLLPGVPREMRGIFEARVAPLLKGAGPLPVIRRRALRTTGISESALFERLSDLGRQDCLAYLPQGTGVDVCITVKDADAETVEATLDEIAGGIRARVDAFIYGEDDEKLEEVVGRRLRALGWKIAVAESCTGGLVASRLTDIPGSSDYFDRGVVTYSNRSKIEVLGVPEETLARNGAVSAETASAMAVGIREASGVDLGLAVTGIAGPSGGSAEKPVGLVFVGLCTEEGTIARRFDFTGDRVGNKERTAQAALEMLRQRLLREAPR